MQISVKSTQIEKDIGELKKPTQKYSSSEKLTQKSCTSSWHIHPPPPPPPIPVQSSVEEIVLWFSYEQKFQILRKLASVMSCS